MSNSATLQTLLDRVAANCDVVISATGFGNQAQVIQWLNDGLQEIHYLLANSGEDYFDVTPQLITLVTGTSQYALNADFYKVAGVDLLIGGASYDVPRIMAGERNLYTRSGVAASDSVFGYRILGNNIHLIPASGTGQMRVNYVPTFAKLAALADVVHQSVPEGWEAYAIATASAKQLAKEESDPSVMLAEAGKVWQQIKSFFEPRDRVEPMRIVDTHGRFTRHRLGYGWER